MVKYIVKRRRRYYAVLEIPKSLRKVFGKPRFFQSLKTESLSVAELRVMPLVYEWKRLIASARGTSDLGGALTDLVARVRVDHRRLQASGLEDWAIEDLHMEFAETDNDMFDAVEVVHRGRVLLSEHVDAYLASLEVEQKTIDMRRTTLQQLLGQFRYADEVNHSSVKRWFRSLDEEGQSRATLQRKLADCNGYWNFLGDNDWLDTPSPFLRVLPKASKRKTKVQLGKQRKAFSVEDYERLIIGASSDPQLTDLIVIAAHTGCRIEEICSLTLENVTAEKFTIIDAKTEAGWRDIPIHNDIRQLTARLVDTSRDGYLMSGLTPNKYGDRSNAIGKRFGRLKSRLGYGPDYVFHSLRRSFSTQLENAGVERTTVARLMGHELGDQTFGGYSDGLKLNQMRTAINKVNYRATNAPE